jgi:hypothetical protein
MNITMPRTVVTGAGIVVAAAAAAGLYIGVSRSMSGAINGDEISPLSASTPIVNAKPINAQTAPMDEATIRRIAREEAQALIAPKPSAPPAPKKAAPDATQDDDSKDDDDTPTVPLAPAKPAVPTATPAPATQ